jgi:hypothetical protein
LLLSPLGQGVTRHQCIFSALLLSPLGQGVTRHQCIFTALLLSPLGQGVTRHLIGCFVPSLVKVGHVLVGFETRKLQNKQKKISIKTSFLRNFLLIVL